jgi:T5SS/PEP-CTERM-associated repeat protein
MSILSGADLSFISSSGLSIGRDGGNNNTVLVSGAGSTLSARSVNVGGAGANSGNSLKVQNGGVVTATLASGAGSLATGTGSNSNYYEVTGTNSQMTIEGDFNLGDTAGTANTGGNFLRVASGGTAKFDTTLNINSYNSSGTNYGSNYVKVDAAGTFTSDSTINVKDKGLLQLAATGAIEGRNPAGVAATATIAVASGGRFEAAGSGLGAVGTTVLTTLSSNSTFAVGLGDAVAASTLTLSNTNSKVTLNTGSTFEFGIFGAATSDQLNFSATNILTVGTGVNLRLTLQGYVPVDGDSWTMITGSDGFATGSAANLAAATFVTPSLSGGLSWDTSEFNQTDGWVISVVPEPATVVLLGLSLSALLLVRRRKI